METQAGKQGPLSWNLSFCLAGLEHPRDACEPAAADAKRTKVEQSTGAAAAMAGM
jgi:hypothetical protein